MFCEGLGGNSSLTSLDLRSNQISHVGAAELASALKRNATLRCLGKQSPFLICSSQTTLQLVFRLVYIEG